MTDTRPSLGEPHIPVGGKTSGVAALPELPTSGRQRSERHQADPPATVNQRCGQWGYWPKLRSGASSALGGRRRQSVREQVSEAGDEDVHIESEVELTDDRDVLRHDGT